MANHGPSYGLSRDLERKNQARFVINEAQEVLSWIETTSGHQLGEEPANISDTDGVSEVLKDGIALCKLMEKLGVPTRFHSRPRMPFHMMENISAFLASAKAYGVPEISAFQTVDLYENKQCYKVIECLRSLAGVAQSKGASGVEFPSWVVKRSVAQPRAFPDHVLKKGEMVIPLQYGTNKCASQKGMKPYGLARQIQTELPDVTSARSE